eukprot:611158-Alexandrium_andersonii.AAC.1
MARVGRRVALLRDVTHGVVEQLKPDNVGFPFSQALSARVPAGDALVGVGGSVPCNAAPGRAQI